MMVRYLAVFAFLIFLTKPVCEQSETNIQLASGSDAVAPVQQRFQNNVLVAAHDLQRAYDQAQAAYVRVADMNDNLSAIARLNFATLDVKLNGTLKSTKIIEEALEDFDVSIATPSEQIHFCNALFEILSRLQIYSIKMGKYHALYAQALRSCNDQQLVLDSLVFYCISPSRIFPKAIPYHWAILELTALSQQMDCDRGRFAIQILKARREGRLSKNNSVIHSEQRLLSAIGKSKKLARATNETWLLLVANRESGYLNLKLERFDEAIDDFHAWVKCAKQMQDVTLSVDATINLAMLYRRKDQRRDAVSLVEDVQNESNFEKACTFQKQGVATAASFLHEELGNFEKAKQFDLIANSYNREKKFEIVSSKLFNSKFEMSNLSAKHKAIPKIAEPLVAAYSTPTKNTPTSFTVILMGIGFGIAFVAGRYGIQRIKAKENSNEQEQLKRRARQNHRRNLDSLEIMAGGIAHDFNNLLVGVMSNAEVLGIRYSDDDFIEKRTSQIINNVEKASDLSRQMLAYAGKQTIESSPLDLNALVNELADTGSIQQPNVIKLALTSDQAVVEADKIQIGQVIANLISNSALASSTESPIIVRTGRETIVSVDQDITVVGKHFVPGEFVYVEVEDFGCGIEFEDILRIFEPFYSGRDEGRGLGLAFVYGVVVRHDGLVRTVSTPNSGTCIRVLLPLCETAVGEQSDSENNLKIAPVTATPTSRVKVGTGERLLVVDDNQNVLKAVTQFLQLSEWKVVGASGGEEAIAILKKRHAEITGIVLDVNMPNVGGEEVIAAMHELKINVPIIIMSGFSTTRLESFLKDPLVAAVMQKPFRMSRLIQLINESFIKSPRRRIS